jgi:putative peptidoglycan lipid II flippase
LKFTTTLGSFAAINVLLAFGFNWYTMTTLGPGPETDALYAGLVIPGLMLAIFIGSFESVLVPILATEKPDSFAQQAWTFFQGVGMLYTSVAVLLGFTAFLWAPFTVPGFDANTQELVVSLIQIHLVSMVGNALFIVLAGIYHARQKFLFIEISTTLSAFFGLGFLIWGLPRFGVQTAAWATVIKVSLQILCLIPVLGAYKKPDWGSATFKEAWRRMRPLMLGNAYFKTDQLVNTYLASLAPAGGLTLLFLAHQIYSAGHQILGKSIANPIVPLLAKKADLGQWKSYYNLSNNRTGWMLGITVVVFSGIVFLGKPALMLIFGHGRFDESSLVMLWTLMIALVGFWMGGPIGQILASSFYAKGNTTTPTKLLVIGFTLGIFFKLEGFYLWGVLGIAVGTSLYSFLNLLLLRTSLMIRLKKRMSDE